MKTTRLIHIPARSFWGVALVLSTWVIAITAAPNLAAAAGQYDQSDRTQIAQPRITSGQVQQILARIRTDAAALRRNIAPAGTRGGGVGDGRAYEDTLYLVDSVVQAVDDLSSRLARRQVARMDVEDVLRHGSDLDRALADGIFRPSVGTAWTRLRTDLNQLASAYSLSWDWRNPQYSSGSDGRQFSGTYQLSARDSDDPQLIADRALRAVAPADRTRVSRQLENRLTPPDVIAIDRDSNDHFTIASSRGPQVSFDADGRPRTEQGAAGRSTTTRATLRGDELEVTTSGSGGSDFSVTFTPTDNGRTLRVARRLYNEALGTPVTVRSTYTRTSDVADWTVYDSRTARAQRPSTVGAMTVPTNTTFVAALDQPLNVRTAREGERITLTVTDGPTGFRDATIEGYVSATSERVSNRTGLSIDFDRIQMGDGRSSDFYGTIEGVRDPNGRDISVDRATVDGNGDRTEEAVQRGAIGAAIGAVLGAVIGGGKGAAIGAVLGAGGGAGTVLVDASSQSDLPRGTVFTIRSGAFEVP